MIKFFGKNENHPEFRFNLGGFSFLSVLGILLFSLFGSSNLYGSIDTIPAKVEGVDYFLPNIDLTHWKVTLPIPRAKDGKAQEVRAPQIYDYANNDMLHPFMYNDSTDGSIVFHAYPGSTTRNTKYSRCELREQMVPGNDKTNWTFSQGGRLFGKLSVPEVSKNETSSKYEYDRVIVMQIHGRLSNAQKEQIQAKDNNAPPILKIYWIDGKVRVKTKVIKYKKATEEELLHKDGWGDDDGYTFYKEVGHDPFTLEVIVTEGRMEVILDGKEKAVYKGKHMEQWGIFENYFKAGNYLQAKNKGAFAKVKYYELEVSH